MKELIIQAATVFMGFFAIMNPIANTPIFLGLTDGYDRQTTKAVALRALALSFLIILVFCLAGKLFFHLFGISLSAFRITGGILVFLIGYQMLQGQQSSMHSHSDEERGSINKAALDIAVSPLSLPILAGPGTIATAMNYSAKGGLANVSITIAAFAVLHNLCLFCLRSEARRIYRRKCPKSDNSYDGINFSGNRDADVNRRNIRCNSYVQIK